MIRVYGQMKDNFQIEFIPNEDGLMIRLMSPDGPGVQLGIMMTFTDLLAFAARSKCLQEQTPEWMQSPPRPS